jgi:hypothetical protein
MRIRLDNSAFLDDLIEFLRRCECRVEQVGPKVVRVELRRADLDAALNRVRLGYCTRCGGEIERVLTSHGSVMCQDCRDGIGASALNGRAGRDWARMELGAFLRVWQLRHPETQAQLLG